MMALHFKVPAVTPTRAERQAAYFKDWYVKNRLALTVQRAERYRDDPVYRAKAKAAARAQRARRRA